MTTAFIGVLVVLALVDSTSFGTLLIPIWLLLTPGKLRISRLASYLGTVVLFYFLVGLALAAGADSLVEALREPLDAVPSLAWRIIQLVVGIVLIILSYVVDGRVRLPPVALEEMSDLHSGCCRGRSVLRHAYGATKQTPLRTSANQLRCG